MNKKRYFKKGSALVLAAATGVGSACLQSFATSGNAVNGYELLSINELEEKQKQLDIELANCKFDGYEFFRNLLLSGLVVLGFSLAVEILIALVLPFALKDSSLKTMRKKYAEYIEEAPVKKELPENVKKINDILKEFNFDDNDAHLLKENSASGNYSTEVNYGGYLIVGFGTENELTRFNNFIAAPTKITVNGDSITIEGPYIGKGKKEYNIGNNNDVNEIKDTLKIAEKFSILQSKVLNVLYGAKNRFYVTEDVAEKSNGKLNNYTELTLFPCSKILFSNCDMLSCIKIKGTEINFCFKNETTEVESEKKFDLIEVAKEAVESDNTEFVRLLKSVNEKINKNLKKIKLEKKLIKCKTKIFKELPYNYAPNKFHNVKTYSNNVINN